jgi:putative ABC transport system permease protein
MEANGSAEAVYLLLVVGLLVLGIAWVNYVNLATAKATERAKK